MREYPVLLRLVDPLERRYRLAFVLVQRMTDDGPVAEFSLALRLLPAERVLHPVDIVALLVVLTGVGTS